MAAGSAQGKMELDLNFGRGRVFGDGRDSVGDFVFSGLYDARQSSCSLLKTYLGQHDVDYDGIAGANGIRGTWSLRNRETRAVIDSGTFHIWPLRGQVTVIHDLTAEIPVNVLPLAM